MKQSSSLSIKLHDFGDAVGPYGQCHVQQQSRSGKPC